MLTEKIASLILIKLSNLVNQNLAIVSPEGKVLASNRADLVNGTTIPLAGEAKIEFSYGGNVVGAILLPENLATLPELAPLIKSIAELLVHQSVLIDTIPKREERLDKFVYDLLERPLSYEPLLLAEAKLFEIDLGVPKIALVAYVDDPDLTDDTKFSYREAKTARYKKNIMRGLESFYTSSPESIVSYLGKNVFCIFKELAKPDQPLEDQLENFKKNLGPIHQIIKSELKVAATIGVGNYHPGLAGLRHSFQEATNAADLGAQMWDRERVYHIDDFGVVAPLLSGVDAENTYFSRDLLDRLGASRDVLQTLDVFLKLNMNLTDTAKTLGIHRNTLVYRLDRITNLLGLDPRRFDDAVQIKLAMLFELFVEEGAYAA